MVYLIAPVLYLTLGVLPVKAYGLALFVRLIPFLMLSQAMFLAAGRNCRHLAGTTIQPGPVPGLDQVRDVRLQECLSRQRTAVRGDAESPLRQPQSLIGVRCVGSWLWLHY